jgi:phytoene/squalene synthetase
MMDKKLQPSQSWLLQLQNQAQQTYYSIRLFVDRKLVPDAYRAYGYFRWVDDTLDVESGSTLDKLDFIQRQQTLLDACYRGESLDGLCDEEWMLVDLIRNDPHPNSGLQAYLRNMMEVMIFDARRRGRIISQAELSEYTRLLATAVTEALYYFIGHHEPEPRPESSYLAVTAAHMVHMLRDTFEDTVAGYFNIPREVLQAQGISPRDLESQAYRKWVCGQIQLARSYFKAGKEYLAQVKGLRFRLVSYAYIARFEWVLRLIEREHYCLRHDYPERKSPRAGVWIGWSTWFLRLISG